MFFMFLVFNLSVVLSFMTDSDFEGDCLYDVLSRPLKAERGKRDDVPNRSTKKRSASVSSDVGSDAGACRQKKRRRRASAAGQKQPGAPSSNAFTDDEDKCSPTNKWMPRTAAAPNVLFTRYAVARTASHREKLRNMKRGEVARTHDQKGGSMWNEYKHTFNQLRANVASARSNVQHPPGGCTPSIPQHAREQIEEARGRFYAASRGLQTAKRRHMQAQMAEQCSLDAAKALIRSRRKSEETLRLALASVHPCRDLVRLRLATTLRQSVADTAAIISLSEIVGLSRASATAIAEGKVSLFESTKCACRYNREAKVCRLNGTGGDSWIEGSPLRLRRLTRRAAVPVLPKTAALDESQASIPDPWVNPRMRVVLSQLRAIATAAAKSIAEIKRANDGSSADEFSAGRRITP